MLFKDSDFPEKSSLVDEAARYKAMPLFAKIVYPYYYFWLLPEAAKARTPAERAMVPYSRRAKSFWTMLSIVVAVPLTLLITWLMS